MDEKSSFLTTPAAILLGAFVIAVAILFQGGVIKLGRAPTAAQPTTTAVGGGGGATAPQPQVAQVEVEKLKDTDHIRGQKTARILLFEYSDLECPFCKRFHPTAQQAVNDYKGQVAWVYRHFPLDQIHPKARKLAEATECANEMAGNDAFWKMADKIFEQEIVPEISALPALASQIGLDQGKLKSCLDSGKYAAHVEEDYQGGIKAGVTGTPGNVLLDTKTGKTVPISGAVPYDTLKSSIDSLLGS